MRSLSRSLLRILVASLASLAILLGLAAAAVTQPTFRALPAGERAALLAFLRTL